MGKDSENQSALAKVLGTTASVFGAAALAANGHAQAGSALAMGAPLFGEYLGHVWGNVCERDAKVVHDWTEETVEQIEAEGIQITEKLRDLFRTVVPRVAQAENEDARKLLRFVTIHAARLQDADLALVEAAQAQMAIAALPGPSATVLALLCAEEFPLRTDQEATHAIRPPSKLLLLDPIVLGDAARPLSSLIWFAWAGDEPIFRWQGTGAWLRDYIRGGFPLDFEPPKPGEP